MSQITRNQHEVPLLEPDQSFVQYGEKLRTWASWQSHLKRSNIVAYVINVGLQKCPKVASVAQRELKEKEDQWMPKEYPTNKLPEPNKYDAHFLDGLNAFITDMCKRLKHSSQSMKSKRYVELGRMEKKSNKSYEKYYKGMM